MITVFSLDGVKHTIRKEAIDRVESAVQGTEAITRIWLRGALFSIDCTVPHDDVVSMIKTA